MHVLFYIMPVDHVTEGFFAALARAQQRGVEVRVLCDQVATARIPGSRALRRRLLATGVGYRAMLSFQPWRGVYQRPDLRNHRKLFVIDTKVAYTGSQNIIEPGYRRGGSKGLQWSDLMARVEGPLAHSLEALFVTDDLLDIAKELEAIALADDYFIERKLYPNCFLHRRHLQGNGFPHKNVHRVIYHRSTARVDRALAENELGGGHSNWAPPAVVYGARSPALADSLGGLEGGGE